MTTANHNESCGVCHQRVCGCPKPVQFARDGKTVRLCVIERRNDGEWNAGWAHGEHATEADLAAAGFVRAIGDDARWQQQVNGLGAELVVAQTRIAEYKASEADWRSAARAAETEYQRNFDRIYEAFADSGQFPVTPTEITQAVRALVSSQAATSARIASLESDRAHLAEAAECLYLYRENPNQWHLRVGQWFDADQARGGVASAEPCHKCGGTASINDYDDGMGPPVCGDCYAAEPAVAKSAVKPREGHGPTEAFRVELIAALNTSGDEAMKWLARELEKR